MKTESDIATNGYPIDENGFLVLKFIPSGEPGHFTAKLSSTYSDDSPLVRHILPLITIEGKDGNALANAPAGPTFDFTVPPDGTFSLKINKARNDQSYADFAVNDGKVELLGAPHRKLIVSETQMIGRHAQTEFPGPADYSGIQTPIVDQHTHLSAQISGADLIKIGEDHHIYYPTSILDKLGIDYPGKENSRLSDSWPEHGFQNIKKLKFLPYAKLGDSSETVERGVMLNDLNQESLRKLQNAMGLSPEGQSTVEDMEKAYFHREPFTKNLELLPDILHKIAEDYKRQGIRYAELSSNAVLDPEWLLKVHKVMSEPDMDPTKRDSQGRQNVMIRFRPGLPRNLGEVAFKERIEKYKRVAASPFIAGPDILGFEMNKTNHMKDHLETLGKWISNHEPEDSIQIHAGENSKNPKNVRQAIDLALHATHGIRVLVGHALYGIDKETLKLAKEAANRGKLMVQFNFISNLAGNNIDYPHDVDVSEFFNAKIPCLNNSDGAGFYYADAKQTAMMAAQCGFKPEHFRAVRDTEEKYIVEQQAVFERKMAKLHKLTEKTFFEEAAMPLPPIQASPVKKAKHKHHAVAVVGYRAEEMPPLIKKAIEGKRPLFFAGAGGKSWEKSMSDDQKREFAIGFRMMLEYLDPEKVYFLKGRTKEKGGSIGVIMNDAIKAYNDEHMHDNHDMPSPFLLGTLLAQNESTDNHGTPGDFTLMLPTAFVGLPSTIAAELKQQKGAAFCIGGKAFTRNFIVEFHKQGIPLGLMDDLGLATGNVNTAEEVRNVYKSASSSKARVYPELAFRGAKNMVEYAYNNGLADQFIRTPEAAELDRLYEMFGREYDARINQKKVRDAQPGNEIELAR